MRRSPRALGLAAGLLALAACATGPRGYPTAPPTSSNKPGPTNTSPGTGPSQPVPNNTQTGPDPAVAVAAGGLHTCAVLRSGAVDCWGRGGSGELGDGNLRDSPRPVRVVGLGDVIQLALGDQHSCALMRSGQVQCWGSNAAGQLGDGAGRPGAQSARPTAVRGLGDAAAIAAGPSHTCAVRKTGQVVCWGDNRHAQIGDLSRQVWASPALVPGVTNAGEVVAGARTAAREYRAERSCAGGQVLTDSSATAAAPAPPARSPGSTACRRSRPARATPARSRPAAARCAGAPASASSRSTSPASPGPWP
ncbi:hypothetical protein OV079_47770 [Nannocystis pusilla]|uniref:Uncharacterized protein n=1 Tax=Nannocystis pusilla TaxID=889268 RepID=A0A9X3J1U8_9BACT|nr:hypothetical protein [Nannocystis pusilla]MCY1013107.1 hypothetical protein [Nannocystis pusilla]